MDIYCGTRLVKCLNCGLLWRRITEWSNPGGTVNTQDLCYICPACHSNAYEAVNAVEPEPEPGPVPCDACGKAVALLSGQRMFEVCCDCLLRLPSPRQDAPQPPQDARTGPPEAKATPNTTQHVLEAVLQNATVRVDVAGTIRCCTVAQPGPGRNIPVILLDGKPWLVNMTVAQESVKEG